MELKIKLTDGRWLVNGKKLSELNAEENSYLNLFFLNRKATELIEDINNTKKQYNYENN
jgi:hypothetical protein